jgi:hypothetical protein
LCGAVDSPKVRKFAVGKMQSGLSVTINDPMTINDE